MRQDKLRKQRGEEHDAFRVSQVHQHRALKQAAARRCFRHRIKIDRARRAPLLNAEPHQIGRARPFQHFKRQQRLGKERAQPDPHQHDMDRQAKLQAADRGRCAAIAVADAGAHGINRAGTGRKAEDSGGEKVSQPPFSGHGLRSLSGRKYDTIRQKQA